MVQHRPLPVWCGGGDGCGWVGGLWDCGDGGRGANTRRTVALSQLGIIEVARRHGRGSKEPLLLKRWWGPFDASRGKV